MKATGEGRGTRRREAIAFIVALALLLAAGWFAYHPGLSGDFLFDDFGNLPAIGATGPIDHWATFWRYITSGTADPTGRPLTLLSFLLDARDWPASPRPFKITNVLLHLLNGALLATVLLRLGRALRLEETRARMAALFGTGAWLLHPLLVSTTLYIVQREAMLPATFVLIGLYGWMASRDAFGQGHVRRGFAGMLLSAWGCTLLATLSKANGALLPLLLLLVEWIVLAPSRPMPTPAAGHRLRRAVWILLALPTALLAAWLLLGIPGQVRGAREVRDWTMGQRLLTEPRVIVDYLRLLFVPHAHSSGLFNDAFPVSTGWLHPGSTLPCVLAVLALIGAGFALRRRAPAVALALLFYFAAQLLESGWIPLELYYEHRNYLPSMLLFWPIGIGLGTPGALRWLRGLVAAAILVWLASLTLQRASLWGNGYKQALVWVALNPDSARAQAYAAQYDMQRGRPRLAAARLRNALDAHPHDLQIPVSLIGAECQLDALRPQSLQAARRALATTRVGGTLGFDWLNSAIEMAKARQCRGLDFAAVQSLLDAARGNRYWQKVPGRQQDLAHLQGMLDLAEGKPQDALREFDRALALEPRPGSALEQAAMLGASGEPKLGLEHLDYFATLAPGPEPGWSMARIHAWVLHHQHYWEHEIARLRSTLAADAAKPDGDTAPQQD
ncbi:MAG TPA: tetratricopeptide repeat protein [Rhodanobacteraceae bacterium]